ncbi:MAG: hypothetical protein MUD12_12570 [Spirochaetes bacterium]|jgi:class 3 adenylate cyclase|nr:hypothetical protein [Spirochaetota bacterium]
MLQIIAALLSIIMGIIVVVFGQEKRVKPWFFLLCVSCAVLTIGHLVETRDEAHTFIAARIVMTAALVAAVAGAKSATIMCGITLHRAVWIAVMEAALINIVTVLATDWYFTGEIIRYPWGHFVAGRVEFIVNPLSVSGIVTYALIVMFIHYRRAHPLDKNRMFFIIAAFTFLSLTLFDYLPHFGIDVFGGLVSAVSIPLFLASFGYASLRYRLIEFRAFLGRAAGYAILAILMISGYSVFMEITRRLGIEPSKSAAGAAGLILLIYATIGRVLPRLVEKAVRQSEPDYQKTLEEFSSDVMNIWDEKLLIEKTGGICTSEFLCSSASMLDGSELAANELMKNLALKRQVLETEIMRRRYSISEEALKSIELIVPLVHSNNILGALALGKRKDGRIFTRLAIQGFHTLGNIVTIALANSRAAAEIQKRHQLDRYLAPQVVESVLSGEADMIDRKQRVKVTIFFSDLKDFTKMADGMNPESLASVLNEYLSEMAEIAFSHGGTVDKFIGDAVMVFFGAPVGDDTARQARQCVRMAVAMQCRIAELNRKWTEVGLLAKGLVCRIGIHTGDAIVGSFGSSSRVDYTAIGSSVNLASRLEGACRPGMILVSAETRDQMGDEFRVTPMGEVEVKGFSQPVRVFEVDPGINPGDACI